MPVTQVLVAGCGERVCGFRRGPSSSCLVRGPQTQPNCRGMSGLYSAAAGGMGLGASTGSGREKISFFKSQNHKIPFSLPLSLVISKNYIAELQSQASLTTGHHPTLVSTARGNTRTLLLPQIPSQDVAIRKSSKVPQRPQVTSPPGRTKRIFTSPSAQATSSHLSMISDF